MTTLNESRLTGALCAEIRLGQSGEAPEWIHLLPLGPEIAGRDGRRWTLLDPETFVRASAEDLPAPLDYMHASEVQKTGEAPAAGWITELRVVREGDGRAPGIWGRVDWTPRGRRAVAEREYRYISPAFLHAKDGMIIKLTSAGLVHRPNLDLTALNAQAFTVEQRATLCRRMGLPDDATLDTILARVDELRSTADVALARAECAEARLLSQAIASTRSASSRSTAGAWLRAGDDDDRTAFNAYEDHEDDGAWLRVDSPNSFSGRG